MNFRQLIPDYSLLRGTVLNKWKKLWFVPAMFASADYGFALLHSSRKEGFCQYSLDILGGDILVKCSVNLDNAKGCQEHFLA